MNCGNNFAESSAPSVSTPSPIIGEHSNVQNAYVTQQNTSVKKNVKTPGKTLLKVMSILCIIVGIIFSISGIWTFTNIDTTLAVFRDISRTKLIISTIVTVANFIIYIFAGINGLKNTDKLNNAQLCFKFGLLMVAGHAMNIIMGFLTYGSFFGIINNIPYIIWLVIPTLYIIGANKVKKYTVDTNILNLR